MELIRLNIINSILDTATTVNSAMPEFELPEPNSTTEQVNSILNEKGLFKIFDDTVGKYYVEDKDGNRKELFVVEQQLENSSSDGNQTQAEGEVNLPKTPIIKTLCKIYDEDDRKLCSIECMKEHKKDWNEYSRVVDINIIKKQINQLLEFGSVAKYFGNSFEERIHSEAGDSLPDLLSEIPKIIINNIMILKAKVDNYLIKYPKRNKDYHQHCCAGFNLSVKNEVDESFNMIKQLQDELYQIVKEVCCLSYYIIEI
ncbi:hypothetical protein M9Y10_022592 [Tritrichomonas musculus]|uniref:Uncharacterized protein n=1 Tax=Tritrichomonas musculus TaxID=1915356 RepID=A0ABR2KSP2_9EUKA